MFAALFLCGCGAPTPETQVTKKPIRESEYLERASGIVVEILGDTGRAKVSSEALQAQIEEKTRANPAWLQNPKEPQELAFVTKFLSVTNFYHNSLDNNLDSFVRESPSSLNVVSNAMSVVVTEFLGLRDAYAAEGFDDKWKAGVIQRAGTVYSALSNAISRLNIENNIPDLTGLPEECFKTSYRSPYQRKRISITPAGPAPDERMIVEHILRFHWLTGSFQQRVSTDQEERVGNFQLIGPYVVAPLPTIRTNRTTQGQLIKTNLAVVIFFREKNSVLKTVFSDLGYLENSEFRLGDCTFGSTTF